MIFPSELGLIILFSIIGGVFAVRFKQPAVLGLIITGAIVGPNLLGWVKSPSLIETAIEVGAILLMFTIGTEFSLTRLISLGTRTFLVATIKMGLNFLAGYYAAVFLGFGRVSALYIGVILSITSTVILMKILEQKGFSKRKEVPLLVAILILEDIFGVFALTFFSGINSGLELKPVSILTKVVISLTILFVVFLVLQRFLNRIICWLIKHSTEETTTLISLGLCGGMSYIAVLLNLSASVGAFLAGNIVSSLPGSAKFEKSIRPFTLFFTSLFFFSIGTVVSYSAILQNIHIIAILLLVYLVFLFAAIGISSYFLMNSSGKSAVFSALAMIPIGEFSLLIARESMVLNLGADLVSITAAIILFSSLIMSFVIGRHNQIYLLTRRILPEKALEDIRLSLSFINNLSLKMNREKVCMDKVCVERRIVLKNLVTMISVLIMSFWGWKILGERIIGLKSNLIYLAILIIAIAVFFPFFNILKNLWKLSGDILQFFIMLYPRQIRNEKRIFRNLLLLGFIFLLLIISPGIFAFFNSSVVYYVLQLIFLLMLIYYILRIIKLIHTVVGKRISRLRSLMRKK
ncbi:cation:proton antiporter [Candidatus Woesearchaeota archaeon]|nr:cation:proton antiporter [Candidatus Woesearchaeota archaeon]